MRESLVLIRAIKNHYMLLVVTGLICVPSSAFGDGVIHDCTFSANSLFSTGEVVSGSGSIMGSSDPSPSGDPAVPGVILAAWTHEAPGFSFEIDGDPNGDINRCRENGTVSLHLEGTNGLVDGDPGFGYIMDLEDNRGPEPVNEIRLCATLVQSPRTSNEGESTFSTPRTAIIPAVIPVVEGLSGSGKVRLSLDRIKCSYRGTGTDYAFVRCAGPDGHELMPGDMVAVSEASLRVQSAVRSEPVTSVQVDLGTALPVGAADTYTIVVFDPSGAPFYDFSRSVQCGDIAIDLIHP